MPPASEEVEHLLFYRMDGTTPETGCNVQAVLCAGPPNQTRDLVMTRYLEGVNCKWSFYSAMICVTRLHLKQRERAQTLLQTADSSNADWKMDWHYSPRPVESVGSFQEAS